MKLISLFFAIICTLHLYAQFPTQSDYGIILEDTELFSSPNDKGNSILKLFPATLVYALQDKNNPEWAIVKTGNSTLGYTWAANVGLFTSKNLFDKVTLDNKIYNLYFASTDMGGWEISTPFLIENVTSNVSLLHIFERHPYLCITELSDKILQFCTEGPMGNSWDFKKSTLNSFTAERDYYPDGRWQGEQASTHTNFTIAKANDKKIYAVQEVAENEYQMAENYAFVVAKTKISVYADANSQTVKTYLNSWETAAISPSNNNLENCRTKILLKNGQVGYINYAYSCSEDNNLLFFNSDEDNIIQVKGQKYQLVTASKIDKEGEGIYLMTLLIENETWGKARPIVSNAPASQNDLYASRFIEYSFYEDGGSSLIINHSIQKEKMRLLLIWADPEEEGRAAYYYQLEETDNEIHAVEQYELSKEVSYPTSY